nr:type II toxin-antitoxin system HipA family toxin [Aquabacterium terrae]
MPERIARLRVSSANTPVGELIKHSVYSFRYAEGVPARQAVSLFMPPEAIEFSDGELFPAMDMNLPEGYLFQRIHERFRKSGITKMHLLALMGDNGIGRVGYALDDRPARATAAVDRQQLLRSSAGAVFEDLVDAYLGSSIGVAGVQPKLMLPSRTSVPIPDLIVKAEGADYPRLAANEFLCLSAAAAAGIAVPRFELNDDASLLLIDRFDLGGDGPVHRLGFEDIAALMGLRVHDRLSNRKYHGSYEAVAEAIRLTGGDRVIQNLQRLFEQVALSIMVRNGDAHLKNFGLLYDDPAHPWLSPLFDVVTTAIYRYERPGGFLAEDRTLALRLRRGDRSRAYPDTEALLGFGRAVCQVAHPQQVIERIADAMSATLHAARGDARVAAGLVDDLRAQWDIGLAYARHGA